MADEKEKTGDQEGAKKGLPPLILVAVGAMIGGASTVFMTGGAAEAQHAEPVVEIGLFDHPETMTFTFNPRTKRGHKTAIVSFQFAYKCDKSLVLPDAGGGAASAAGGHGAPGGGGGKKEAPLGPVPKQIKANWNRAYSRCLTVLMRQTVEMLNSPDGKEHLRRLLIDELTASLFPDGKASVDDVLWKKFYVQA